ncbi:hypothetical protein [Aliarcobacter butzleri]|uniref:hypothetical protein n=1 Tax=Aliarcobacter butzleri TaxID=28197 RepID=UPI001269BF4E|nr:hypothetical protein [Aliarcobacter butzleri]
MNLAHTLRGFFVEDKELKQGIANLVAMAIYTDSIIRPSEVKQGYEILEKLFDGEDYEYLQEEVDILLDRFQKDAAFSIESKEQALNFIKENKHMRKELVSIVKLIYRSDHDSHRKEEKMLSILENNEKKEYQENGENDD